VEVDYIVDGPTLLGVGGAVSNVSDPNFLYPAVQLARCGMRTGNQGISLERSARPCVHVPQRKALGHE
jgi:hypothetical protein